jgi:predicted nucleotidyltransferase
MKKLIRAYDFIEDFMRWASARTDIQALALVGSYARDTATKTSDVDLVILTDDPQKYLNSTEWTEDFGSVITKQIEDYGMLTSLRVWYKSGLEIEYGFTTPAWAQSPLDEGTRQVIEDGMRVLFERVPLLSPHETPRHRSRHES